MLWNPVFQCNIPHIDAQHKALFEYIEHLGTMHGDLSRIPETVEFLERYIAEHFEDERSLHRQTRYPRALEHMRQHLDFAAQIAQLRKSYEQTGHNLPSLMNMNSILVDWLKEHVLNADREFARFYHMLPESKKRELWLPRRPWIPESSQSFYREMAGLPPQEPEPQPQHAIATSGDNSPASLWNDSMLCGIPVIDEQHKALFHQIDLLRDRNNSTRVPNILRFLADYVIKHFNDEESFHLRTKYPDALQHRKLHADFVKAFSELKGKYDQAGGSSIMLLEINNMVFDWLKNHVMKVDRNFADYYHTLNAHEK